MSDRLAVLRNGRVEQVGAPAEVYEKPATPFVADFVGTSNLLEGEAALASTGSPDPFTIRPEKIRLLEEGTAPQAGDCSTVGRIRDVVYLGMYTRYLVEIEGGALLAVVEQNRDEATGVLGARGRSVRLAWSRAQVRPAERPSAREPA